MLLAIVCVRVGATGRRNIVAIPLWGARLYPLPGVWLRVPPLPRMGNHWIALR